MKQLFLVSNFAACELNILSISLKEGVCKGAHVAASDGIYIWIIAPSLA